MVERAKGGECYLAQCHIFQGEENKSICEVATGAECTFAAGASYVLRVCVCVFLPEPAWWLAGLLDFSGICALGSLCSGEP